MPYSSNSALPDSIKVLPTEAQSVWRRVFNENYSKGEDSARKIAWTAVKNGWKKTSEGKWVKKSMSEENVSLGATITKLDNEKQIAFGWFSVIEENGEQIVDKQGSIIDIDTLEEAAYDFVINARVGAEMHINKGVATLVESMVFTKEKQAALGIDLGKIGWWGGMKITDNEVWKKIKKGEYKAFSIGGRGRRLEVEGGEE